MRRVLHILTTKEHPLATKLIAEQQEMPDCQVEIVDWTENEPDCDALLDQIFSSSSVEVW